MLSIEVSHFWASSVSHFWGSYLQSLVVRLIHGKYVLHLNQIRIAKTVSSEAFIKKASGRYYTGELAGRRLANAVVSTFAASSKICRSVSAIDPFGGDGRLLIWLLDAWDQQCLPPCSWQLELWDLDDADFSTAKVNLDLLRKRGIEIECSFKVGDAFQRGKSEFSRFDIVITNPPWELLKPDRRELEAIESYSRAAYISSMKAYDSWLADNFPMSQPRRKFAGWGTNLSRVGLELSMCLSRSGGVVGIVLPASILADDQSARIRENLLTKHAIKDISYYPAEANLFEGADVPSVTIVTKTNGKPAQIIPISSFAACAEKAERIDINVDLERLSRVGFVLPVSFGARGTRLVSELVSRFPLWGDLESSQDSSFWAGREIDESRSSSWLLPLSNESLPFLKGRMIERYRVKELPKFGVLKLNGNPPVSVKHERIAWRDVSRPSQKRRVIATIIPPGWILGNSLGVAFFSDGHKGATRALLGVMNSTVFEFMLRAYLATGHVSLSALRKVPVPSAEQLRSDTRLQQLVNHAMDGSDDTDILVDAYVARRVYKLVLSEYSMILDFFPKLNAEEKARRCFAFEGYE